MGFSTDMLIRASYQIEGTLRQFRPVERLYKLSRLQLVIDHRPAAQGYTTAAFGCLQGHHRRVELLSADGIDILGTGFAQPLIPIGIVADYMKQTVSGQVFRLFDCIRANQKTGSTNRENCRVHQFVDDYTGPLSGPVANLKISIADFTGGLASGQMSDQYKINFRMCIVEGCETRNQPQCG